MVRKRTGVHEERYRQSTSSNISSCRRYSVRYIGWSGRN